MLWCTGILIQPTGARAPMLKLLRGLLLYYTVCSDPLQCVDYPEYPRNVRHRGTDFIKPLIVV